MPAVVSIQVGQPRAFETHGHQWRSAIAKEPVRGPVLLGREGLAGDAHADLRFHGGPDKAVLAYCTEHYAGWRAELGRDALPFGSFGENLTVEGLLEDEARIGDTFALGAAVIQISQPRTPCQKLARRL